ncbi:hypothetical protein BCR33DRAFT_712552 [Rhizoclosmatium globosum]|uniref:Uncharacterized protein n=1 Tax=Rhizoclosmatium globosum TaxID=329046 RepID=A0A1Y2CWV2_9FUNG|nr:hypothetical protein BCR33DRAFT_712552 [Rhizoclosmatium globosum]|eukprot:ORY51512.1 hypothetical protein BCR33DRAFT_712552 [Rhizoclosmatium globosum]
MASGPPQTAGHPQLTDQGFQQSYVQIQQPIYVHEGQVVQEHNLGSFMACFTASAAIGSGAPQSNIYHRIEEHAAVVGKDLPVAPEQVYTPSPEPIKKKSNVERFLCCCCPKKRKHRFICAGVILVFLIVIGTLIGIYFPRYPQIKVYAIDISNIGTTNTQYSFTYPDPEHPNLNQVRFQMNLTMYVGTFNPNRYDLPVDHIDMTAQMLANQTVLNSSLMTRPLNGYGKLVEIVGQWPPSNVTVPKDYSPSYTAQVGTSKYGSIVFPANSWVNYTMTFNLDYTPDQNVGLLLDPTIMEMASACGITDRTGKQRPMVIGYNAASTINSLKAIFTPTISGSLKITCPFSQDQINSVIEKVQAGEDAFQAIQETFGSGGVAGPKNPNPIQDWETCAATTDICASNGFRCCVAPADAGAGKLTCRDVC